MGILRGDLPVLGIANLLQCLHLGKCEGHLVLEQLGQQRVFYLNPRGVRLVSGSKRCQRLEKLLRRVGPVASGREAIGHLVREWTLEEMSDLLSWTRGAFKFQEGPELPRGVTALSVGPEADVDLMTVILESTRRMDDLPRIRAVFPDLDAVPECAPDGAGAGDPSIDAEALRDVLPFVDGIRSLSQIVEASAFPRHSVLQVLYGLSLKGSLALRIPEAA